MPLDEKTIARLTAIKNRTTQTNHKGPLGVLRLPGYCTFCPGNMSKAMYTVNGVPLCTPHAMYQLSKICVDNDYHVQVAGRVNNGNSDSR
jgi:hypothetical protein